MKKMIAKVKVDHLADITAPLLDSGRKLGQAYEEFDRIFVPHGYAEAYKTADRAPKLIIRTITKSRKQDHLLIMKRLVSKQTILFFQTPVLNYDQMAHIVNQIGYEFYGEVKKTRRQLVAGSITFIVDQIDEDGWYLKVEKTVGPNDPSDLSEVNDVVSSLGIKSRPRAKEYVEILKEKNHG